MSKKTVIPSVCIILFALFPSKAQAASSSTLLCGVGSLGHCYGLLEDRAQQGEKQPTFDGAAASVDVVQFICSRCSGLILAGQGLFVYTFLTNEIWLGNADQGTWVEVGYETVGSTSYYFWADLRPQDCPICLHTHYLGAVPAQDIGYKVHISITKVHSRFHIMLLSHSHTYQADSEDNHMVPTIIDIGQEVAGTVVGRASFPTTVSAPRAYFDDLQYKDSAGHVHPWISGWFMHQGSSVKTGLEAAGSRFWTACGCEVS